MAELMTREDYEELKRELEDLKVNGRAEMAEKIRTAREFGDLSENAEYDIAKDEQAKMEARIIEIENKLANAQIYEKTDSDNVSIGHMVRLKDLATGVEEDYELVGSHQANPMANPPRISVESPIGKAILDKKVGDKVAVKARAGEMRFEVIKIS